MRLMRRARVQTGAVVLTIGCVGSLAAIPSAQAQTTVTSSGQTRSIDCRGQTVQITGSKNTLTVTGECRKVDVAGVGNTVSIEAVERIEVTGTNNRVTWQRALGGDTPRIARTGMGNSVSRDASASAPTVDASASAAQKPNATTAPAPAKAAPATAPATTAPGTTAPPTAATPTTGTPTTATPTTATPAMPAAAGAGAIVKLVEDGRTDTVACGGRHVSILGSRNSLRLRGTCPMVIVSGSDNIIDIDTAERIRATGDRNRLTWFKLTSGTQPKVENTGRDNRVSKADM